MPRRKAPSGKIEKVHPETFSEHNLYPILRAYLKSELNVYSKRIDEKKSLNNRGSGGNKWLYPDVVGVENLTEHWPADIIACAREHGNKRSKLWSFEVKLRLNPANVRESFFQTVSNSLWANYAYLVAAEIQNALPELRVLSSLHGVGIIELNIEEPTESVIVLPARERDEVDWGSVNRIFQQNSDFQDYVSLVKNADQTGQFHTKLWD